MSKVHVAAALVLAASAASAVPSLAAEPVMVQCGREYQAAKAAGTLNGLDWSGYRTACAARLKAASAAVPAAVPASAPMAPAAIPAASATTASPAVQPAAVAAQPPAPAAAAPSTPATPVPSAAVPSGTAAMHARQKQCGAEWTATKATLVAATPGLTWPKYWSQCNARLKAAGR